MSEYFRNINLFFAVFDVRKPSISPDDDVFQYLAKVYANAHPFMHKGQGCPHDVETFKGGITNGAEWYPVTGLFFVNKS